MENKQVKITGSQLIGLVSGALTALIGLLVIIGWVFHFELIVRLHPTFVPMMFNTALGLFFCGTALLAFGFRRTVFSNICGTFVTILGMLSTIQYAFVINIGIDNLFIDPYLTVESLLPGRMAANTAVAFILVGASILLLTNTIGGKFRVPVVSVLISLIGTLGISVLIAYALKFDVLSGWGQVTRMALHTAVGFVLCAIGLFGFYTVGQKSGVRAIPRWISVPIGVALATMTFILWQALETQESQNVRKAIASQTQHIAELLEEKADYRVRPLERQTARLEEGILSTQNEWERDAPLLFNTVLEYCSINLLDSLLRVTDTVISEIGSELSNSRLALIQGYLARPDIPARKSAQIFSLVDSEPVKGCVLYISVPYFLNNRLAGFLLADIDVDRFLTFTALDHSSISYAISILAGEDQVVLCSKPKKDLLSGLTNSAETDIYGAHFKVQTWPTEQLIKDVKSSLPEVVMTAGLALAVLTALMVHFGLTARSRTVELSRINESLERKIQARTKELLERDEFTRQWLNKCTDGAFDWNLKTDHVLMTPQFKDLLGYKEDEIGESRAAWRQIILPMDLPVAEKALKDHLEKGVPYSYQLRFRHKEGAIHWAICRGIGIKDDNGETTRMVGTLTDISNLKQLEEELTHRAEEMERKNSDLERFNRLAVGREKRMIELKSKINALSKEMGKPEPYKLAFVNDQSSTAKIEIKYHG